MNKAEILEKAQKKKPNAQDEMEMQVILRATRLSVLVYVIAGFILMVAKQIAGLSHLDLYSILILMASSMYLYKGIKLKKRAETIMGIVGLLMGTVFLVLYCISIFR